MERALETTTRELAELARLADGGGAALDDLLRRGLDWLARLAPYDLAVVFQLVGDGKPTGAADRLVARAIRGPLSNDAVRGHALLLEKFPTIRAAIEERRARAFTEDDHAHGDGDPFDGVLDLPHGHSCMVVPLIAGDDVYGVMTLDRRECVAYPQAVVDLVEIYARLLALTIRVSEQAATLAKHKTEIEEQLLVLDRRITEATEEAGILATSRNARVRDLAERAELVAATSTPVLLLGETGTGKERLARTIHALSPRAKRPFVAVNCAAIPATLLETELFGHERGAFSGATRARLGLFRSAEHGTIFLDEIGELPVELQAKLLRVLQSGEVTPVGGDRALHADVRVIAATHVDLEAAVRRGRFRADLYYRLGVYPLTLIPLRERREDLPELSAMLLADIAKRIGRRSLRVSSAGIAALAAQPLTGNIRELGNILERAAITSRRDALGPDDFALAAPVVTTSAMIEDDEALLSLADHERRHIERVLRATEGRVYGENGAAAILGVPPSTLQSRMKKLGITRVADA
jgi:transcriptional regulator with GAF, ATPase, and Fis domain